MSWPGHKEYTTRSHKETLSFCELEEIFQNYEDFVRNFPLSSAVLFKQVHVGKFIF